MSGIPGEKTSCMCWPPCSYINCQQPACCEQRLPLVTQVLLSRCGRGCLKGLRIMSIASWGSYIYQQPAYLWCKQCLPLNMWEEHLCYMSSPLIGTCMIYTLLLAFLCNRSALFLTSNKCLQLVLHSKVSSRNGDSKTGTLSLWGDRIRKNHSWCQKSTLKLGPRRPRWRETHQYPLKMVQMNRFPSVTVCTNDLCNSVSIRPTFQT